jgi:hypothetical protein
MSAKWASGCWAAATTATGMEYAARLELERFGPHPYLPQHRRKFLPGAVRPAVRCYPLFPRYLFIPASEARAREVRYVRQLQWPKPLLCDGDGVLWTATAAEIFALAKTENEGGFDEFDEALCPGARVRMKTGRLPGVEMFLASSSGRMAEIFLPLFGGVRGVTALENVVKTG